MTGYATRRATPSDVETALLLLSKLGVTLEDLTIGVTAACRPVVPTFAEFIPDVAAATSAGTLKAYGSYWNRIIEVWGIG